MRLVWCNQSLLLVSRSNHIKAMRVNLQIMYSQRHPSMPCFPSRVACAPLWMYPELMPPIWLAMKKRAPRLLSSERLYQQPRYHCTAGKKRLPAAPTKKRMTYNWWTFVTLYWKMLISQTSTCHGSTMSYLHLLAIE